MQPLCCGNVAYDAFSSYCCNGRVQAKYKNNLCCGQSTYDTRFQVCHQGNSIMQRNMPGSTCCRPNGKWQCCRHGQGCCRGRSTGSVDIPGFRPACCEISSTSSKARCCSIITQKVGAMPSCCNADRVRPICCRTSSSSFQCCQSTYGLPSCCQGSRTDEEYHPYYPQVTRAPSHLVPVHPTPLPRPGSCCLSRSPQPYCCQAMRPNAGHGTNYQTPDRSVQQSKPRCCTYRYSCCSVRSNARRIQCCKRPSKGAKPLCCAKSQPATPLPPLRHSQQHKCYSCKLNGNYQGSVPLVSTDNDQSNDIDYGKHDYTSTGGGQGWARLSCCQSNHHKQCCRNAHRLTGIYASCCDPSDIVSTSNNQQQQPSTFGNRKAVCSGRPYEGLYQVCCYGVLRRKMGPQSSCCGTQAFNPITHKCCSGSVKRTCSPVNNGNRGTNWTQYSKR